jgi:hypothetical protein
LLARVSQASKPPHHAKVPSDGSLAACQCGPGGRFTNSTRTRFFYHTFNGHTLRGALRSQPAIASAARHNAEQQHAPAEAGNAPQNGAAGSAPPHVAECVPLRCMPCIRARQGRASDGFAQAVPRQGRHRGSACCSWK